MPFDHAASRCRRSLPAPGRASPPTRLTPGSAGNLGTFFNNKSIDCGRRRCARLQSISLRLRGHVIYIVPSCRPHQQRVYGEFGVTTRFNATDDILTARMSPFLRPTGPN
jgi:hypothetical protein